MLSPMLRPVRFALREISPRCHPLSLSLSLSLSHSHLLSFYPASDDDDNKRFFRLTLVQIMQELTRRGEF